MVSILYTGSLPINGAKIDIRDINFDKKINEDGTFSDEDSISLGYSL